MPCFDHDSNSDLLGYMAMAGADPEGARAAFSEFYGRHVDWVHRMVKRLPPNRSISGQDVVDIVQDTFLDAYKGAGTFKPMASASTDCDTERRQARAWLGGIAKNVILQHLAGGILLTDVDDINAISSTTDLSEESALVTATREALDSLEERDNDILLRGSTSTSQDKRTKGCPTRSPEHWPSDGRHPLKTFANGERESSINCAKPFNRGRSRWRSPDETFLPTSPLDTEQLVYTAARSMGWIIPTTENEVRATEDIPLDDIPLPDALKNPLATLDEEVARAHRKRRHLPVPPQKPLKPLPALPVTGQATSARRPRRQ